MNETNPSISPSISEQDAGLILQKTLENAKTKMEGWIDGNGMHKSAVRISEKQLTLIPVTLHSSLQLVPLEKETRIERPDPCAQTVSSRADMAQIIQTHVTGLLSRNDIVEKLAMMIRAKNFGIGDVQHDVFRDAEIRFVLEETCKTCQGKGQAGCQACHGSGQQACTKCHGRGNIPCPVCHGHKHTPASDGSMQPCHECGGYGQSPCPACHQKKNVTCAPCTGTGKTSCKQCNATGRRHVLITVDFKAEITGRAKSDGTAPLPQPADILLKNGDLHLPAMPNDIKVYPDRIETDFTAVMPQGTIGFSLNGKRVDTNVSGINATIRTESLFIDSLIKPGIAALNKIARGPMATAALFQRARTYRTVRDVTDQVSRLPRKKILKQLQETYPVGLSDKYAKAMIKLADVAVGKITIRPRWIGTGVSVALFGIMIVSWFHLGLRPNAMADFSPKLQLMVDGLFLGIGLVGSSFIIKKLAHTALKTILGTAPPKLPKAGDQALIAFGILAVIFIVAALTANPQPGWTNIL